MFRENLINWIAEQEELECCGEAGSLSQAQIAVERQPPDLILLDLFLGNADGFDFLQWLKSAAIDFPSSFCPNILKINTRSPRLRLALAATSQKLPQPKNCRWLNAVFQGDCYISGRGAFPASA
jgi:Response regulator containing a CheY-like receiver domain and an HTH DNA-binding domain